jgi:hypothetical protein
MINIKIGYTANRMWEDIMNHFQINSDIDTHPSKFKPFYETSSSAEAKPVMTARNHTLSHPVAKNLFELPDILFL